ncbi:MAG: class I SAM-dependent methyltransferase [Patescibacteria group bacterium]
MQYKDYELLDSGEGEKLERFGSIVLSRPDPQALWHKNLDLDEWKKVDADFSREGNDGKWKMKKGIPDKWSIEISNLKFIIKPTAFKHVGIFPEQVVNWEWMKEIIRNEKKIDAGKDIEVLNLFGYTGGATLSCAEAEAKVVHVDGSKSAINWARENAELSGLSLRPIRWIFEDARVFVGREIKRGNKYDAIIMDPPAFGHGPKKEIWKIEEHFLPLVEDCFKLLKDKPLFFIINGYSAGYSAIAYKNILKVMVEKYGGSIGSGELTLEEKESGRLLPCGIFARWGK